MEVNVCVNETGVCHPTVQSAINNATSYQTVVIVNDSYQYNENVVVNVTGLTLTSNTSTMPVVWSTSSSIVTVSSDNVTVRNIVLISNGTGATGAVAASNILNLTVANNTINNTGSDSNGYGVYFSNISYSSIENNNITTGGGERNYGIYLSSSPSNAIMRNSINSSGTQGINRGMYLESSSYLNVTQNSILTSGTSGNDGIRSQSGSYLNVTQNTILTSGIYSDYGIIVDGTSNIVSWNTVSASGTSISGDNNGIVVSSTYSNFMWNTVFTSGSGPNNAGIYLSGASSNTFTGNNFTTNSSQGYGVYINSGNNNTFYDSKVNASEAYDVFLTGTTDGTNNYFVNVSFNKTDIGTSASNVRTKLFNQYRFDSGVLSEGLPIQGATIYGNDTDSVANSENPTSNFSATTNSTGYITQQILTEFAANGTYNSDSSYLYFTNYTITVSKEWYRTNVTSLNATQNILLSLILNFVPNMTTIFGKGTDSYSLAFDSANQDNVYAVVNSVNASYPLPSGWSHVAMTFDSGTIKLYLNGQLVGTASTSAIPTVSDRSLMLGNGTGLSIDEVTFRSGALTQAAISQHYQVGPGLKAIVSAVGSGSFGRDFDISASTSEGSFSNRHITTADLLAGTTQSVVLPNVTGVPATIVVTSNSCNQVLTATKAQLSGVYC